jgi:hypothetical protein
MFRSIVSAIKTWSSNFNAGSQNAFEERDMLEYQQVAPLCTSYQYLQRLVEGKRSKRLFVRGWTAYNMSKLLFRTLDALDDTSRLDVWMERDTAEAFRVLEDSFWDTGQFHVGGRLLQR